MFGFFLIQKIIIINICNEEDQIIGFRDNLDIGYIKLKIDDSLGNIFLMKLFQEILKKKSKTFLRHEISIPCTVLGNFKIDIIRIKDENKIMVAENEKKIKIKSSCFNLCFECLSGSKTLILTIFNIFDIFKIENSGKSFLLEVQNILEIQFDKPITFELGFFKFSVNRHFDYFYAF